MDPSSGFILFTVSFSSTGLACALLTLVMFIRWRAHPLIKASSCGLSCLLLVGIMITYGESFLNLITPGKISNTANEVVINSCFFTVKLRKPWTPGKFQECYLILFVYWPITAKFKIRKQTSKLQSNVNCELPSEELNEGRSSKLYTQLLQLRKESLKTLQACTGFEPSTCAIPVQRSTS